MAGAIDPRGRVYPLGFQAKRIQLTPHYHAELANAWPGVAFQASGGVSGLDSLEALATTGAAGAIVGRALLEGRFTVEEAAACLQDA